MYSDIFIKLINNACLDDILINLDVNNVDSINLIAQLKANYPDYPINDILSLKRLQKQYHDKLLIADQWILTDKNAQQASSYLVAKYHGNLFSHFESVADLCCGIGMDLFFLAQHKIKVFAVDLNPDILSFAKYNMFKSKMLNIEFLNIKAEDFDSETETIFIDPDRRVDEVRSSNPFNMSPALPEIEKLLVKYPNLAIKLSPMLDYDKYDIFKEGDLHFLSEHNELKEILFCTGSLKKKHHKTCVSLHNDSLYLSDNLPKIGISNIDKYLIEPDVSIIKAHLVESLALELQANKIDEHLALLTSSFLNKSDFAKYYHVNEIMPFSIKSLNLYLKSHKIGILDIKTRGFSETVEAFRNKIKLKGKNKACLFIVRLEIKHVFVITDLLIKE